MDHIANLSAVELRDAIVRRELCAVEAVDAALDRISQKRHLNAFISVIADQARAEARNIDARLLAGDKVGPLAGTPFSAKDLIETESVRTTYGSRFSFDDENPPRDAIAVKRTRAAGGVLIGKTTTPEFGHKPLTEAPLFGRTLNPFDATVTCGGSSGGAAVAVATGMGQLALGTDGGGSNRIPAACCGVVGLKATVGAIPNLEVPDLFASNICVGPLARTVDDISLFYSVLFGPDGRDPYGIDKLRAAALGAGKEPLRIGWMPKCGNRLNPEIESICGIAIRAAEDMGMLIEPVELDFVSLESAYHAIMRSTLAARFSQYIPGCADIFDKTFVKAVMHGAEFSVKDVVDANRERTDAFLKIQAIFQRVDVIASPVLSYAPVPVNTEPVGPTRIEGVEMNSIQGAWYPYTYPFNLSGHPALSLPCGYTASGLPVGLQLAGRWNEEELLLGLAKKLEAALSIPNSLKALEGPPRSIDRLSSV